MTFVTAWWTALWSVWFVHHLRDGDQEGMLRRAAFLSRLILSVILLGGASGKWTPEYWTGDVLYDIYFRDRDFWLFNLLRENFDPARLREIATWQDVDYTCEELRASRDPFDPRDGIDIRDLAATA